MEFIEKLKNAGETMANVAYGKPEKEAITEDEILKAIDTLSEYKRCKANLENRVVEDELWWELRHWEVIGKSKEDRPEPTSAWLFNAIANKHADAMDNYPIPIVLPREESDRESAKILTDVLPVEMEYNDFENVYSINWWDKLKHGTAIYGVFWDSAKENGLGDVTIKPIDLLKIFWEPGITNIQDSKNLFIVELIDNDVLSEGYPELKGKLSKSTIDVKQYMYDDTVDTSKKTVVVDWYYKKINSSGKQVLHYVKFVGNEILYASENDTEYKERGFYDHANYPVVFDCLFPEKGTPVGFGYVSVCKEPQLYIDKISANIIETSMMNTKKRFFVSDSTNINEDEFLDWTKPIVHVNGEISDTRIKEITCNPLNGIYVDIVNMKIEEMKDTGSNRDVNSGGYGSGVTAAAAISALQEAGNKISRDMISASYRSYCDIINFVIELMRQFYDEARAFRILSPNNNGDYSFVNLSNEKIKEQKIGVDVNGFELLRKPIFDLKLKAQRKNPFSRIEQNEIAKELYAMGFFNPEMSQQAMIALDLMSFEGKEEIIEKISQGATLMNIANQLKQENDSLKVALAQLTGQAMPEMNEQQPVEPIPQGQALTGEYNRSVVDAQQRNITPYMNRMAKNSVPTIEE